MGITPWPEGERKKTYKVFVGSELRFLKLGSVLVGFEWRCVEYFLKARTAKIYDFEVKCVFWPVDWN